VVLWKVTEFSNCLQTTTLVNLKDWIVYISLECMIELVRANIHK